MYGFGLSSYLLSVDWWGEKEAFIFILTWGNKKLNIQYLIYIYNLICNINISYNVYVISNLALTLATNLYVMFWYYSNKENLLM